MKPYGLIEVVQYFFGLPKQAIQRLVYKVMHPEIYNTALNWEADPSVIKSAIQGLKDNLASRKK